MMFVLLVLSVCYLLPFRDPLVLYLDHPRHPVSRSACRSICYTLNRCRSLPKIHVDCKKTAP